MGIKLFHDSLCMLPNYVGKTFVGDKEIRIDRSKFVLDSTISWKSFISTQGKVDNMSAGTILMIKCKTAKHISAYSSFPFQEEIVIMPNTSFVVKNWYKCTENVSSLMEDEHNMQELVIEEIESYGKNQDDRIVIELEEI